MDLALDELPVSERQKVYGVQRLLHRFVSSGKPFPPVSDLAQKLGMDESQVEMVVDAVHRFTEMQNMYKAMNVVETTYRAIVKRTVQSTDLDAAFDHDMANAADMYDSCSTDRLATEFGLTPAKIDEMKADVIRDELLNARIHAIAKEYGLTT